MYLSLYWGAFINALKVARDEREEIIREALMRMKHGLMQVAFYDWAVAVRGQIDGREEKFREAIMRMRTGILQIALQDWSAFATDRRESSGGAYTRGAHAHAYRHPSGRLHGLAHGGGGDPRGEEGAGARQAADPSTAASTASAVEPVGTTSTSRYGGGSSCDDGGALRCGCRAADSGRKWGRCRRDECRGVQSGERTARSDREAARKDGYDAAALRAQLAPLPHTAVEQAAYQMMRSEVEELNSALAATQKQMQAMNASKAAKSDISDVRTAVHRFLFGAPTSGDALGRVRPTSARAAVQLAPVRESTLPRDPPLEVPMTLQPQSGLPAPRPPTAQRPRIPRPTTANRTLTSGVTVAEGGGRDLLPAATERAATSRPTSARAMVVLLKPPTLSPRTVVEEAAVPGRR